MKNYIFYSYSVIRCATDSSLKKWRFITNWLIVIITFFIQGLQQTNHSLCISNRYANSFKKDNPKKNRNGKENKYIFGFMIYSFMGK